MKFVYCNIKQVATLLRTSAAPRHAAHRCHREPMTMRRNELLALSSANILPPTISSRFSARKSPRMLCKKRCVHSSFCKVGSPSANSHPTCSRPRHPSASCALKGLQLRKYCPIFCIEKEFSWMLSHSSCRCISSSVSVVGQNCLSKMIQSTGVFSCNLNKVSCPNADLRSEHKSLICPAKLTSPGLFLSHHVRLSRRR